jgi:hypothetical protein
MAWAYNRYQDHVLIGFYRTAAKAQAAVEDAERRALELYGNQWRGELEPPAERRRMVTIKGGIRWRIGTPGRDNRYYPVKTINGIRVTPGGQKDYQTAGSLAEMLEDIKRNLIPRVGPEPIDTFQHPQIQYARGTKRMQRVYCFLTFAKGPGRFGHRIITGAFKTLDKAIAYIQEFPQGSGYLRLH